MGANARPPRRACHWCRPTPRRLTQCSLTHTTWTRLKTKRCGVGSFNESQYDYILNPFLRRTVCSWLPSLLPRSLIHDTTSLRYSSLVPSCLYCLHVTQHGAVTFVTVIVTVHKWPLRDCPLLRFQSTDNGEMEMMISLTHPQIPSNVHIRAGKNLMWGQHAWKSSLVRGSPRKDLGSWPLWAFTIPVPTLPRKKFAALLVCRGVRPIFSSFWYKYLKYSPRNWLFLITKCIFHPFDKNHNFGQ